MPTAPAQRCANVANENKWTYDENRVLLGAIEQFSNGKIIWDVVTRLPTVARSRGCPGFDGSAMSIVPPSKWSSVSLRSWPAAYLRGRVDAR